MKWFSFWVSFQIFHISPLWNVANDHHSTLKEDLYDEKVDIVGLYEAEQKTTN